MASIFDLTDEMQHLMMLAETDDGEISYELAEALGKTEAEFNTKVESWLHVIGELEAVADARKAEADRIKSLSTTSRNAAERMKTILLHTLQKLGLQKVETTRYKVRWQRAGKSPLLIGNPDLIPDSFCNLVRHPDKEAIREALERGEQLGFATLGDKTAFLVIK